MPLTQSGGRLAERCRKGTSTQATFHSPFNDGDLDGSLALFDPHAEAIKELSDRIANLEKQLAEARGAKTGSADVTELRPKKGPSSAGG